MIQKKVADRHLNMDTKNLPTLLNCMAAEQAKNTRQIIGSYEKTLTSVIKRLSRRRGIYKILENTFLAEESKYN